MSTNKASYLSLKLNFEEEFDHFLKELLHVRDSRERKVQVPESLRDFVV